MRYLSALLIFVLTTINVPGWTLSLAPRLIAKNAILYVILLTLAARFVVARRTADGTAKASSVGLVC